MNLPNNIMAFALVLRLVSGHLGIASQKTPDSTSRRIRQPPSRHWDTLSGHLSSKFVFTTWEAILSPSTTTSNPITREPDFPSILPDSTSERSHQSLSLTSSSSQSAFAHTAHLPTFRSWLPLPILSGKTTQPIETLHSIPISFPIITESAEPSSSWRLWPEATSVSLWTSVQLSSFSGISIAVSTASMLVDPSTTTSKPSSSTSSVMRSTTSGLGKSEVLSSISSMSTSNIPLALFTTAPAPVITGWDSAPTGSSYQNYDASLKTSQPSPVVPEGSENTQEMNALDPLPTKQYLSQNTKPIHSASLGTSSTELLSSSAAKSSYLSTKSTQAYLHNISKLPSGASTY